MRLVLSLITKAWGWMLVGLAVVAFGAFGAWNGRTATVPERDQLAQLEGVVQSVTKRWKEKAGVETSVKYELEIAKPDNQIRKLTVPGSKMTEQVAGTLEGQPITALLRDDDEKDVWELSVNGVKFINYEATRTDKLESLAWQAENGPYFAGGGLVLFLLGSVRLFRSRATA